MPVFGGAHRFFLKLRVAQLAGDAFFIHPVEQRLPGAFAEGLVDGHHILAVARRQLQRRQAAGCRMHAGLAVHGFAEIHPVGDRALGADGAGIMDCHVDVLALARRQAVEQRHGDGV